MVNDNPLPPEEILKELFQNWSGSKALSWSPIMGSGSNRRYFRISSGEISAIGVFNQNTEENLAYFQLTRHFATHGIRVPEIYSIYPDNKHYLIRDLGDHDLLSEVLSVSRSADNSREALIRLYTGVIQDLIQIQITAGQDLDYTICHPVSEFGFDNYLNDLLYFRYYFLNLSGIGYSEEKLMRDFQKLSEYLTSAGSGFFSYRDFQARNILMEPESGKYYYIDFQGGRKGPLQYDLASLLFQAKAGLSPEMRLELINVYLEQLEKYVLIDKEVFMNHFWAFALVRMIQTLGAYGLRGIIEKKVHFLRSIPPAMNNLRWFLNNIKLKIPLDELTRVLNLLSDPAVNPISKPMNLNVNLFSFSYRKTIPTDESGNGGGFLFDCRCLPNPGRLEPYRALTGNDREVIEYLAQQPEVHQFLDYSWNLIKIAVNNYIERGFTHLSIGFGCTGGQHRSVYCARIMYQRLRSEYNISVNLTHTCIA